VMPRRRPEDGRIDWTRGRRALFDWVRALTHPYPGAFTELGGRRLSVWRAEAGRADTAAGPGTLLEGPDGAIEVATGDGTLRLHVVQWEGEPEAGGDALRPWLGATFELGVAA
jgi:methionyl-tRNA formyltransferase